MTHRWFSRLVLLAAGIVLVGMGASFAPIWFYAEYGIVLGGDGGDGSDGSDVELTSELRAAGFALLLLGLVVGASALRPRLAATGASIGTVVLLGYAGGRLLSWAVDGAPSSAIAVAGAIELALGIGCAWVLRLERRTATAVTPSLPPSPSSNGRQRHGATPAADRTTP